MLNALHDQCYAKGRGLRRLFFRTFKLFFDLRAISVDEIHANDPFTFQVAYPSR